MDDPSTGTAAQRLEQLLRENRRWRRAGFSAVAVAVLLVLSALGRPRELAAQLRPADAPVILKFGGYYLNAQMITYIDFQSDRNATQIYFAGDMKTPLRLNSQYGETMRPWLDGHSFDLTGQPLKDPTPESIRKAADRRD